VWTIASLINGEKAVLDTADSKNEALMLRDRYFLAFGSTYVVYIYRTKDE
jgi:hypothetical protein